MPTQEYAVNENRILQSFLEMVSIDSESWHEQEMAAYLEKELSELGLEVFRDREHEYIHAVLEGGTGGESRLFSSHMDTVKPGTGKSAVVHPDGKITSDGTTVLGADDVSGLVSILEAVRVIRENNIPHPDIELLFTSAEEPYCEGSRYVDYGRIKAKTGYVLDLTGPVGTAAVAAPTILAVTVTIKGKAAHAGFAPEDGVNAFTILGKALARIDTGRVGQGTTVNFGLVEGGTQSNIVPDMVSLQGEIRSMDHEQALAQAENIRQIFAEEAGRIGGVAQTQVQERIRAYRVTEEEPVVRRFLKAAGEAPRCSGPACITTFGGSDANRLNAQDIRTIVLACAMENCHSTEEYTTLEELKRSAELTLRLMTIEDSSFTAD